MATDSFQIELSPQQYQVLGDIAARTQASREQVLSSAIEQYQQSLDRNQTTENETLSLAERMRRNGLLGCLKGGPADLSTNPVHFEGFGRD